MCSLRAGTGVRTGDGRHEIETPRRSSPSAPASRQRPIRSPAIWIASSRSSRTWSPTRCATLDGGTIESGRGRIAATSSSGWPIPAPASRPSTRPTSSIASTRRIRRGGGGQRTIGIAGRPAAVWGCPSSRRSPSRHGGRIEVRERAGPDRVHRDAAAGRHRRRRHQPALASDAGHPAGRRSSEAVRRIL